MKKKAKATKQTPPETTPALTEDQLCSQLSMKERIALRKKGFTFDVRPFKMDDANEEIILEVNRPRLDKAIGFRFYLSELPRVIEALTNIHAKMTGEKLVIKEEAKISAADAKRIAMETAKAEKERLAYIEKQRAWKASRPVIVITARRNPTPVIAKPEKPMRKKKVAPAPQPAPEPVVEATQEPETANV